MTWKNPDDQTIRELLKSARTIAVVGLSPKPDKTSHQVAAVMQKAGYRIIPVYPGEETILGEPCYAELRDIPQDIAIDIVDVFRRAETVLPVAEQAVARKARCLWLQQGIVNEDAYRVASAGGLLCVMDSCIKVMHALLAR
jgi:predicted CoA-binding protein